MSESEKASVLQATKVVTEPWLREIQFDEAAAVRQWWRRLTLPPHELKQYTDAPPFPRGVRAMLRRCDGIEAVLLSEGFRELWRRLPQPDEEREAQRNARLETWASIALVAAELRDEKPDVPLGARLGQYKENTDKPLMSELRFQQLLNCQTSQELIQRLRRALALANKSGVSVVYLADNIAHWWREQRGHQVSSPAKRLGFVWANDYFGASSNAASVDY